MIKIKLFDGRDHDLVAYNGQAMLNFGVEFYVDSCDDDLDTTNDETDFDFSDFVSGYFRIYNERLGRLIKTIPNVTTSGSSLIINTNDMTFANNGVYYYEIGYVQTGGYEIVLMFGKLNVL